MIDGLILKARKREDGLFIVFMEDVEEDCVFVGASVNEALQKWIKYYGEDYGVD